MPRSNARASLFERLVTEATPYHSLSRQEQAAQRIAAIKLHLERLFNARQGCSSSSPELGLKDFNGNLGGTDLMVHIGADIRRTVETFEPRLKVIGLRFHPDPASPLELNFQLDCQVRIHNHEEQVQIDLVINHRRTQVK
jgi:type VI secretion system protein